MNEATKNDLDLIQHAALQTGQTIMSYFRLGENVGQEAMLREKGADNPLTKADEAADSLLKKILLASRPDYGWLSEETADSGTRLSCKRTWVVDPIDGTKEFIIGLPQFAISIALVEEGRVIAGCVYNPASHDMFLAAAGEATTLNSQPTSTSDLTILKKATCLASRSESSRGEWQTFQDEFNIVPMGSIALKLALVACGRYDFTFTLTPKNEWDFCAGTILVQQAGGIVSNKEGTPFMFNQRATTHVTSVVASNRPLHPILVQRLASVPLQPGRER